MTELIRPVYAANRENSSIDLGYMRIELVFNGRNILCCAQACLRLQPDPRLIKTADITEQHAHILTLFNMFKKEKIELRYGESSAKCSVLISRSTKNKVELLPCSQRMTICSDHHKNLKTATFHIVNFPSFLSTKEPTDLFHRTRSGKERRLGRVFLEHDGWDIEIQELLGTSKLMEKLRAEGGYGITHVGRISRHKNHGFSISNLRSVLTDLHLFLSFAHGLWTSVVLPVGFDKQGNRVFEEWGVPLCSSWEPSLTWFDSHHGQSLAELYPGFVKLLHNRGLGKPVSDALYWYLRSNQAGTGPGTDGGLILSQAALEKLAYAQLKDKKPNEHTGAFLCRACRDLGVPIDIPKATAKLYNANRKQKEKWEHSLHALVDVRNDLVHPKKRLGVEIGKIIVDAWNLSQWYIELIVLKLSCYNGQYSNRLRARWRGEVEHVPWGN